MIDKIITWCICIIIFAAPFSKSIAEIATAATIALWLFGKISRSDFRMQNTGLNRAFLAFIVAIIPSLFISSHPALSTRAFFTKALKFVLLYFAIVDSVNDKSKIKLLSAVAFASILTIFSDGMIQHYITGVDILHRYPSFKMRLPSDPAGFFRGFPTASFPYPNNLAAWILLAVFPILCISIFDLKKNRARYVTFAASMGLLYLFFLTKARGAWIGFALSIVYIAVSRKKIWLIAILIVILAIPFILKMEMAQYIFGFGSVSDRLDMWKTGWEIFKKHPIIGSGLNTFFINFKEHRNDEWRGKKGSYAHNCYLQMACDIGLVGLGAFLWIMGAYFHSIFAGLKKIKDNFYNSLLLGLSTGVFAFLVHSFFDTNLYSLNLVMLFWVAIAISQSIIKVSGAA